LRLAANASQGQAAVLFGVEQLKPTLLFGRERCLPGASASDKRALVAFLRSLTDDRFVQPATVANASGR